MRDKFVSYLGFAKRSGNLITGYNTCIDAMNRKKVKLLLLAEDVAENTMKKMIRESEKHNVNYRVYGKSEELSQITGSVNRGIFGIKDGNFANVIVREIDESRPPKKEVFE